MSIGGTGGTRHTDINKQYQQHQLSKVQNRTVFIAILFAVKTNILARLKDSPLLYNVLANPKIYPFEIHP